MWKGDCAWFSGGLGANRKSSRKVTPGSTLEAAFPCASFWSWVSPLEESFRPLTAGVSNPFAGGVLCRGQRATPETGQAIQGGPSRMPGLQSPHALCHRSRAGLCLLCAAPSASSVPSAPNPAQSAPFWDPFPAQPCNPYAGRSGSRARPGRRGTLGGFSKSARQAVTDPDRRAAGPPSRVCPGYALSGALLFLCPLPCL